MKFLSLLPLAAVATAFVVPDESMTRQIVLESKRTRSQFGTSAKDAVYSVLDSARDIIDVAIEKTRQVQQKASDAFEELELGGRTLYEAGSDVPSQIADIYKNAHVPCMSGHDHHHPKPNRTIYELISESKYTTKFAELLEDFPEAVKVLNGTKSNITYFVPTNRAFENIPEHHKKPTHEMIEKLLMYHGSPDFYPAGRVLAGHTVPSALNMSILDDKPQRLRVGLSLKGLSVNFYARIIAINIFATNGVIHAVDHLIIPPPPALKAIEMFPGEYSTLELALLKTGLREVLANDNTTAGTVFAPSNFAFKKLGPRINAFLFSEYGLKYLKSVVEYHLVPNVVLYSDAYYVTKGNSAIAGLEHLNVDQTISNIPKSKIHAELPTALEGKSLSVDVIRYGGLIDIKINGFTSVAVQDGIVKNGVIHKLDSVLIPPKKPGMVPVLAGEDMTVEEFKAAFEPSV